MADKRGETSPALRTELIAQLEQSRRLLMEAIGGLDEEGFRHRHGQGTWTTAEVLAHLLTTERIGLERVRTVLTQDNPAIAWINDDQMNELARGAQRMPVPQIIHGLLAQRRDVTALLDTLSPEQLVRRYQHERRGELTAAALFAKMADHESEHAEQIGALRDEAGVTT